MLYCCGSSHGALSLVRPVLSLVSITSFCLVFCFEVAQKPNRGLIECMCAGPISSHVVCRSCCMWSSRMALQSSAGYCIASGSARCNACFASLSAFSFPEIEACPGIQRNLIFRFSGIAF